MFAFKFTSLEFYFWILIFNSTWHLNQSQFINNVENVQKIIQLDGKIVQKLNTFIHNYDNVNYLPGLKLILQRYIDEWDNLIGNRKTHHEHFNFNNSFVDIPWDMVGDPSVGLFSTRRTGLDWPEIRHRLNEIKQEDLLNEIEEIEIGLNISVKETFRSEIYPVVNNIMKTDSVFRSPHHCLIYYRDPINNNIRSRILRSRDLALISSRILLGGSFFWSYRWFLTAKKHQEKELEYQRSLIDSSKEDRQMDEDRLTIQKDYLQILINITEKKLIDNNLEYIVNYFKEDQFQEKEFPEQCFMNYTLKKDFDEIKKSSDISSKISVMCRGKNLMSEINISKLKCFYDNRGSPYLKIQPVKVEEINKNPEILYFHGMVTKRELNSLTDIALPLMLPSKVGGGVASNTETQIRSSHVAWLGNNSNSNVKNINFKISQITGLNIEDGIAKEAEYLQVNIYGIGGHFIEHHDYFNISKKELLASKNEVEIQKHRTGDRIATVMLYVTDDFIGGGTVFVHQGIHITPVEGSFVYWKNLHPSGTPNINTLHLACPVRQGVKIVANKWIRHDPQIFKLPCDLHE